MNDIDRDTYSINNLIKEYGLKRIFTSADIILAAICAFLFFSYLKVPPIDTIESFVKDLASDLLGVSVSLFGILFAAFAIILSLSDEKFMKFLRKMNVLNKILFPFWLVSILFIINIIMNLLIRFSPFCISKYLMTISVFTFVWAIGGTVYLINDTINFGRRRADYLEYEREIEAKVEKKKGR